jgi:arsenate reductase
MAYAFAQREVTARNLTKDVNLVMGGTRPAPHIHPSVCDAMADVGIDVSDRVPRAITMEELQNSTYIITMGCSADDVCPAGWAGESQDWQLDDPNGRPASEVAMIRDEIERRVVDLFDEVDQI